MASSNYCFFGALHVHSGVFLLAVILVLLEAYSIVFETYRIIAHQKGTQMGPNTTVHQYLEIRVNDAGRFFAEQVLYGDGKLRFVIQYASLFGALLAHVCLLIGNRLHRAQLYVPALYYSGLAILCMICESIHIIIETVKVHTNHYNGFIPEHPIEVRKHVVKTLLSYFFVNLFALALTMYLFCLVIRGKKYLETEKVGQIHPVVVTNEPESEWNVNRV